MTAAVDRWDRDACTCTGCGAFRPGFPFTTEDPCGCEARAAGSAPQRHAGRHPAGELLACVEGSAPPFPAWREFLATEAGVSATRAERYALRTMLWPPGREPTVDGYVAVLAVLRTGTRPRARARA